MAKEITALQSLKERDGTVRWKLFYHYAISPEVTDAQGDTVAVQVSGGLPVQALAYFTGAEQALLKDQVDAGNRGYFTTEIEQSPGESDQAFLARAKVHLAASASFRVQQFRDQYAKTGTQADA